MCVFRVLTTKPGVVVQVPHCMPPDLTLSMIRAQKGDNVNVHLGLKADPLRIYPTV